MTVLELENTADCGTVELGEFTFPHNVFRCHVAILRDEDGRFSVICMNLPGAGSCGETEDEAMKNAREAIAGVIESYLEDQLEIPWKTERVDYNVPEGAKQKWILVHA